MTQIRVLLADAHVVVREGLKRMVETQPDLVVVAEATDAHEMLEEAVKHSPDIVVMDISMGAYAGAQATRELLKRCPKTRVLAFTAHEDRSYVHQLLQAGARGYVLKRAAGDELLGAIRAVASQGLYVDPRVAGKLLAVFAQKRALVRDQHAELSEREAEVLRLIAQGFTNKEISAQLGVSVKTVETYKARSMEKLGLRSRVDIVRTATERGWLGLQH